MNPEIATATVLQTKRRSKASLHLALVSTEKGRRETRVTTAVETPFVNSYRQKTAVMFHIIIPVRKHELKYQQLKQNKVERFQ